MLAVIITGIICLLVGVMLGVGFMAFFFSASQNDIEERTVEKNKNETINKNNS